MARLPRVVLPGAPHLIVHLGHGHRAVFEGDAAREGYLSALRDAAREAGVAVHAYGLLDHELRLLVTPSVRSGLATLIQSVDRRYVRYLNRVRNTLGSPWAGRFRSAVVEADAHYRDCLRFVEMTTPLERGDDGPSLARASVRHHLGLETSALIVEHPAFWAFGNTPFEREAAYRRFAEREASAEVAAILHAGLAGWVIGSDAFAQQVEVATGRRARPLEPGRPRLSGLSPK